MKYETSLLGDLGKVTQGMSVSRYRNEDGRQEAVVNVKNLWHLFLSSDTDVDTVALSEEANLDRYRLIKDDVVIGIRGTLLNSSVVTKTFEGILPGQNVAVFRTNSTDLVSPAYLAVLLRSQWLKESTQVLQRRSSTTLQSIRVSDLRKVSIPLPDMEQQAKIVKLFSLFESYKVAAMSALEARSELVEMSLYEIFGK